MENPLLELQEYENLQEALKKAKGPVQATGTLDEKEKGAGAGQRLSGLPEGTPDVLAGKRRGFSLETGGDL